MTKIVIDPLPPIVPALLDPKFATAMNAESANNVDFANAGEDNVMAVFGLFEPMTQEQWEKINLTQPEIQLLRHILKGFIRVIQQEVEFCKTGAHVLHEAADKNDPSTEKHFKAHSIYRSRLISARKTLRKLENIQRKFRLQLGESW